MKRRQFLVAFGGAALACRHASQAAALRTIGIMMPGSESDPIRRSRLEAFYQTLAKFGWVEGSTAHTEVRWGEADTSRFARQAIDLLKQKPAVLFCDGTPALEALMKETKEVPIVFAAVADPVAQGFVASLSRPGGNVTGFTSMAPGLSGKWLGILSQIAPSTNIVGMLVNPATMRNQIEPMMRAAEEAAIPLGISVTSLPVNDAREIERTISDFAAKQRGGLIVAPSSFASSHRRQIIDSASKHRLPAMYSFPYFTTDGGLIAYGVSATDLHVRSAGYVDRILRGEAVGGLPVQLPTKFELAINLKTANTQGIVIPASLLAMADEIIE